ncbi:MAG: glutamate--tRNA ligase [Candidatus Omnitrophica bacterium]|nr:glutamate--tRNA ligase [Candidatus Omnitrophota bacterium]
MVRVRFAPSPTGNLHIGGARTAIFNWLFAKANNGIFILRIEDTDINRSKKEYLDEILTSLKWLGMDWQEEYYQSKRSKLYKEHAQKLLDKGLAYEQESTKENVKGKAIIYRVVQNRKIKIKDLIYKDIEFDTAEIKDQVLIKSDGTPAYNFACVVDDYLMKISHIIRGDDHISNTPKQIMLYEALGAEIPQFAHLPLILGKGGGRLSKRTGATAISEYRKMGILPEALFNYLLLLGWSPGKDQEIIDNKCAISKFKLEGVNKTAATFDSDKLLWMNNQYLKSADTDKILDLLILPLSEIGFIDKNTDRNWLKDVVRLFQSRLNRLGDFLEWADFFFKDEIIFDEQAANKLKARDSSQDFKNLILRFSEISEFSPQAIEEAFRDYITQADIKSRDLIHPLRAALTGKTVGPGLFEVLSVLGKDKVIKRLERVIKQKDIAS